MPSLGPRGLLRYRDDRVALLAELGDDRRDLVQTAIGPVRLVIATSADIAREILVERAESFGKGPAISRHATAVLGNGLLTSAGDDHRRQRAVIAPKFTPRQIAGMGDTMVSLTRAMIHRWRTGPAPTDFAEEITRLTMSIAARTMFGADVSDRDVEAISRGMETANRWVMAQATSIAPPPLWVPIPRNVRMRRALADMDRVVYRLIDEHRATERDDVLSALLAARSDAGEGMSDELVRDQVMTFFMAGHETVATALSWAFHVLSAQPDAATAVAAEAERVLGDAPDAARARDLAVTRRVLSEIMRLHPPTYMIGRRALTDVTIAGHRVRRGTNVLVNTLGIHRRGDYFADPLAFRPDRHIDPTWPRAAFQPFGLGPRVCIGSHFAMLEGTLVLALVAQAIHFTGDLAPIEPEPLITLRPKTGVPFPLAWR